MLEAEIAETLVSLSAPDERKQSSPLYAKDLPWRQGGSKNMPRFNTFNSGHTGTNMKMEIDFDQDHYGAHQENQDDAQEEEEFSSRRGIAINKKRTFNAITNNTNSYLSSSLPSPSDGFLRDQRHPFEIYSSLCKRNETSSFRSSINTGNAPLASSYNGSFSRDDSMMMTRARTRSSPSKNTFDLDQEMLSDEEEDRDQDDREMHEHDDARAVPAASSSLTELCLAAARDSSRPISIPSSRGLASASDKLRSNKTTTNQKWSVARVKQEAAFLGQDCSPTGVEEDDAWFDSYRHTDEYKRRVRLASVCSSDGGASDCGLGRKHLEEFIRMEISDHSHSAGSSLSGSPSEASGKYIGSYSPTARKKRIERFLEKRKRRVWAKKVDYDVRKNFANSRLRVKGRFVKKEDEELLCLMMSFT